MRNPRAIRAILFQSIFISILIMCIYKKVGSYTLNSENLIEVMSDWIGLSFFIGMDQFFSMAMTQILQIPLLMPVYRREVQSKMYTVHSYYNAMYFSTLSLIIFYPLIVCFSTFWILDLHDTSAANFFEFMFSMIIFCFAGTTHGFMWSCIFDDPDNTLNLCFLTTLLWILGAGVFENLNGANWFVRFMSWTSPYRYTNELILRRLLSGNPSEAFVLEFYDFDYGSTRCALMIIAFAIIYYLIGGLALYLKSRNF